MRLHAGIGYVTPDDEHEGRGPAIRRARRVACTAPADSASLTIACSAITAGEALMRLINSAICGVESDTRHLNTAISIHA